MTECDRYIEMISLMVDGELDESQKTQLLDHLSQCADCRRVMSAFAFLSLSMQEDEEAPESLKADVMAAVRQQAAPAASGGAIVGMEEVKKAAEKQKNEKTPAGKSRARLWVRVGAMAACLALVVFAAAKSGAISAGANLTARSDDASEYGVMTACADDAQTDAEMNSIQDTEETDTSTPETYAGFGAVYVPEPTASPAPMQTISPATMPPTSIRPEPTPNEDAGVSNGMMGSAGNDMMAGSGSNGTAFLTFSELTDLSSVTGAVVTECGEMDAPAVIELTDTSKIAELHALLAFISENSGETLKGDGNYSIMFLTDIGDCRLTVWIVEPNVYCLDEYEGVYYQSTCTAEQFRRFIDSQQQ